MSSVYQRLLGADYQRLPVEQARFHALHGKYTFQGEAKVSCGKHPLAKLVALIMGLPRRDALVPLMFTMQADSRSEQPWEVWSRLFGRQRMTSRLRERDGWLVENLGAMVLYSRLSVEDGCLKMDVVRAKLFGWIPMPLWAMPRVLADETGSDGQIVFHIQVVWAWIGLLVAYQGFIMVDGIIEEEAM